MSALLSSVKKPTELRLALASSQSMGDQWVVTSGSGGWYVSSTLQSARGWSVTAPMMPLIDVSQRHPQGSMKGRSALANSGNSGHATRSNGPRSGKSSGRSAIRRYSASRS